MSAREFKPGDVAMVTAMNRDRFRATFDGEVWREHGDLTNWKGAFLIEPVDIRPLVVIDPEGNPEGLPYLVPQHFRNYAATLRKHHGPVSARMLEWLAERLEEYVPKPRIEEPTGLGAVVEDAEGRRWVFTGDIDFGGSWWLRGSDPARWPGIDVVRVLSEGVTS